MATKMVNHPENRRILVVDDNVLIHEDFRKILQPRHDTQRLDEVRAAVFGGAPRLKPLMRFELIAPSKGKLPLLWYRRLARKSGPMPWRS